MINGKKILAIIPARGGSQSIPNKNIKKLGGKPLIHYTIKTALECKNIDRIVVSSDSEDILNVSKKYDVELLKRPSQLAKNNTAMTSVIEHAIIECEKQFNEDYDFILLLQPTSPFRSKQDIENSLIQLEKSDFDGIISVKRLLDGHPARIKKIENGILKPFCIEEKDIPRQKLIPKAFIRDGAIYLVKKQHFLKHKTVKEGKMKALIIPDERAINIDEPIDFELAEYLISKRNV